MDILHRWSKHVSEDQLNEWEEILSVEEITYTAEKQVKRSQWMLSSFSADRADVEHLKSRFGGRVAEVDPESWQPRGDDSGVIRIRDTMLIAATEDDAKWGALIEQHPDRLVLSFPPQLAFGTGSHPTTAGCMRFLSDAWQRVGKNGSDWQLLDVGSGSGILAIAAAKLGASRVVAVEFDALAMKYARINAERHGVADRIEFLTEDAVALLKSRTLGRFMVLAANLYSDLLEELFPHFADHLDDGAEWIISGFLKTQAEAVEQAAQAAGLPLAEFLRRGKWVAARGGQAARQIR